MTSSVIVLFGLLTAAFAWMWYSYYSIEIVMPFYRRGNWAMIGIYSILVWLYFKTFGGIASGYLKRTDMFLSQIVSVVAVNVTAYLVVSLVGRRFMPLAPDIVLTFADLGIISLWTLVSSKVLFMLCPPRKLVIVHGDSRAADLVLKMSSRVDKYMICEAVSISEGEKLIREIILTYEGVIFCGVPEDMRDSLLCFCYENSLTAYISPDVSDILIRGAEDIRLFDTPLILCRGFGITPEKLFLKRCFDIVFSAVMLVVLSPVMLIAALAVLICDGAPVIYKQKRLTRDGKIFDVYKFRSMVRDAEKNGIPQLSAGNDSRVTPVGRMLRKFRIDELPQLVNILKGDMSVVGPRPERPELAAEYEKDMPQFRYRLKVKAGLTGYAQVTGRYDTSPADKLKMDLMYIENYSFLMDLRMILMTVKAVIFPAGSSTGSPEDSDKMLSGEEKDK